MSASLQRGLEVWREVLDANMASYFTSCVHCGVCAEACLFYTETGDPQYTPIHKLAPMRRFWKQEFTLLGRLQKMLGLSRPVTDEELAQWGPLVYDSCSLCGRCSLVCPVGNDLTAMIRKMREGMAVAGHAPEGLIGATERTLEKGSPMGATWKTVQAQIRHVEADTGLTVPVDLEGAEYLVIMSAMEIVNYPEYLEALARIFHQAGVTWTLSPDAFEATNAGIQIGVSDLARQILARVVNAAERLKVKAVISPECGHAFTALRFEGPNLIGRPFGFEVVHVTEVLDRLRAEGRLNTDGSKEAQPLTYHDPCQIARRGGVIEAPRRLLDMVAGEVREMTEHGAMNWCCGGGGGVSANERADGLRIASFRRKKNQLEETGVKTLVTACANCRVTLEEGLEHYGMDVEVKGLTELVAEHLPVEEKSD
jgi:Fe-S oxidoreductase